MSPVIPPIRRLLGVIRQLLRLFTSRITTSCLRYILALFRLLWRRTGKKRGDGKEDQHRRHDPPTLISPAIAEDNFWVAASRRPRSPPLPLTMSRSWSPGGLRTHTGSHSGSSSPADSIPVEVPSDTSSIATGRPSSIAVSNPAMFLSPNNPNTHGSHSMYDISMRRRWDSASVISRARSSHQREALDRPQPRASSRASHVSTGIVARPRSTSRSRRHFRFPLHTNLENDNPPSTNPQTPTACTPTASVPTTPAASVADINIDVEPASSPPSLPEFKVYPTHVINRYDRDIVLPKRPREYKCIIDPMTVNFSRGGVPDSWVACQHPEGALYFADPKRRIFTDALMSDEEVYLQVERVVKRLQLLNEENDAVLPPNTDLVIEPSVADDGETYWCYYYANHETRTLFWVHEFNMECVPAELLGVATVPQLSEGTSLVIITGTTLMHIEAFPHAHEMTEAMVKEIQGIILFASADQQTSPTSTVLYSVSDLQKMYSFAKNAQGLGSNDYSVATVARLHSIFAHARFLNYHGEYGARLNRDQSVHGKMSYPRSLFVTLFSPTLFNAPYVHLHALERIWVDGTMCTLPWDQFIERLKNEWQEFILFATVLLNANVAFLAIPSVDMGKEFRTSPQVASYVSMFTSVGCIIIGLLLVRQYRVRPRDTIEEAVNFLNSKTHQTNGVETLAILYSLPYALLMWSMVTFLIALSLECFIARDRLATAISAVAWAFTGLLILWCIYSAWEDSQDSFVVNFTGAYKRNVGVLRNQTRELISKFVERPPDPQGTNSAQVDTSNV